jgi:hypothetical protein
MFTTKITTLSRASLAGGVLLMAALLLLSVSQAQAQTRKARARTGKARAQTEKTQTAASSLAEVTMKPGTKLMVILGTGDKVKGKADNIGDGTLSIRITTNEVTFPREYKIRILSESEISQIFQVKGTSRGSGALKGALIGAAVPAVATLIYLPIYLAQGYDVDLSATVVSIISIISGAGIGAAIGVSVVSGEEKILMYENPAASPPPASKTSLLNFRDGRLSFAVPTTYLRPDNFDRFRVKPSNKRTKHIDLVQVDF